MSYPLLLYTIFSFFPSKSSVTIIFPGGKNQLVISTAASKNPPTLPRKSIMSLSVPERTNSRSASLKSCGDTAEKLYNVITKMPSGRDSVSIVGIEITSRVTRMSNGSSTSFREMVSTTSVPTGPRISRTASSMRISEVGASSIKITVSPDRMPDFCAGVFLSGAMTVNSLSRIPISIPTPPKFPLIFSENVSASAGGIKTEYGSSSDATSPSIAPHTRSCVPVVVDAVVINFSSIVFHVFQNGAKSTGMAAAAVFSIFAKESIFNASGRFE